VHIEDLQVQTPDLEDVFIDVMSGKTVREAA